MIRSMVHVLCFGWAVRAGIRLGLSMPLAWLMGRLGSITINTLWFILYNIPNCVLKKICQLLMPVICVGKRGVFV